MNKVNGSPRQAPFVKQIGNKPLNLRSGELPYLSVPQDGQDVEVHVLPIAVQGRR